MRKALIPALLMTVVAACGSDDGSGPMAVEEALREAAVDGDVDGYVALWSDEAVFVSPEGDEMGMWDTAPWPIDDFDGDGTTAFMDYLQADVMIGPAVGRSLEAECAEISESEVECSEWMTDVFTELAGVEDPGVRYAVTVTDGLVTRQQVIEPVDGDWDDVQAFDEAVHGELKDFERWIFAEHRELHPQMFSGSCCTGDVMTTPESMELHEEMLPQYLETVDS